MIAALKKSVAPQREIISVALCTPYKTFTPIWSEQNWAWKWWTMVWGVTRKRSISKSQKASEPVFFFQNPACDKSKLNETRWYCLSDSLFPSSFHSLSTREINIAKINQCNRHEDSTISKTLSILIYGKNHHARTPYWQTNLNVDFDTHKILTTGYCNEKNQLNTQSKTFKEPPEKCNHGGSFDVDADRSEGIAKDSAWAYLSPHHYYHDEAADLAVEATVQFLKDIRFEMCDGPDANPKRKPSKCAELKLLYGVGPSLAFAIDITGSMGNIIAIDRKSVV